MAPAPEQFDGKRLYSVEECIEKFGTPGEGGPIESQLEYFEPPYQLRLYSRTARADVKKVRCHKLIYPHMFDALTLVKEAYTAEEIVKYGLDVFAGCYMPRQVRGGKSWSKHAFAIASDWLPEENGLNTPFAKSTFSRIEYRDWIDCWRVAGFGNLGLMKGFARDAMHFEIMKPQTN